MKKTIIISAIGCVSAIVVITMGVVVPKLVGSILENEF